MFSLNNEIHSYNILRRDLVFLYPIVGQILASFLYDSKELNSVNEDIRNSSSVSLFSPTLKLFLLA